MVYSHHRHQLLQPHLAQLVRGLAETPQPREDFSSVHQQVRGGVRWLFIKFNLCLVPDLALHCPPRQTEHSPKPWVDSLLKCPCASNLRRCGAGSTDKLPVRNSPQGFEDGFLKV